MENKKEKLLELLADQTLFGLSESESAELETLKADFPEAVNEYSFEITAAAINLINLKLADEMPAHLYSKLEAQAAEFFPNQARPREFAAAAKTQTDDAPQNIFVNSFEERKPSFWQWLGWAIAAAACVALALNIWLTRMQPTTEIAKNSEPAKTPEILRTPTPELSAAQKRDQLLASADVVQTNWTDAKDPKKVLGDIVWSGAEQKGFIRLHDLPALDPNKETYQLWIVDAERPEQKPISGGVFNVTNGGEVVIPIDAQLKIGKAKQFVVSKEKAGGVVVSAPDRFVAVAKI